MSNKTYLLIRILVVMIVAFLVAWSVNSGTWLIPIPVAIAGSVILLLFRKGVKEITVDERIYSIAEKAAMLAFRAFGILAAVTGATLVALSRHAYPALEPVGLTLAFSAAGLVLFYYISYTFYNRKFGGRE